MIAEAARTISYYDKGCMVGLLLDLKIRNEKGNKSSLDDVMQLPYNKYYQELKGGYTDDEFQAASVKVGIQSDTALPLVYIDDGSPAANAGILVTDKIVELEGQGNVNKERLNQLLLSKRMGDSLRLRIQRGDETKEISICLGSKMEKSFRITPMEHPDPLQKEIFHSWVH